MEQKEKWVTLYLGDGTIRRTLESNIPNVQKNIEEMKELSRKGGWTEEEIEKSWSLKIVPDEHQKPEVIFNEQYKKYRARVAFTLIEIHNMNETEALAKVAEQEEECYRLWKKNNPSEDTATKITRTSVG